MAQAVRRARRYIQTGSPAERRIRPGARHWNANVKTNNSLSRHLATTNKKPGQLTPASALTQAPMFGRLEHAETWRPPKVQCAFRAFATVWLCCCVISPALTLVFTLSPRAMVRLCCIDTSPALTPLLTFKP